METKYDTRNKIQSEWMESDISLSEEQQLSLIRSSEYTLDQLVMYQTVILSCVTSPDWTPDKPLKILRAMKLRVHHIQLTGVDGTNNSLNHLYQTICLANHLRSDGHIIHLIEGVTSDEVRIMRDIDLVTSKDGVINLIDYTQKNALRMGQTFSSDELSAMKLKKLKHILPNYQCHRYVMSNPPSPLFKDLKLKLPEADCPEFEDDFSYCEHVIPLVHQLDNDHIDQLLSNWVTKFSGYVNDSLVKYPSRLSAYFIREKSNLVSCAHENSESSASTYEKLLFEIEESKSKGYSPEWFRKMNSYETSCLYDVPLAIRVPGISSDPVVRCGEISKRTQNPLAYLLSLCVDKEVHPTPLEWLECPDQGTKQLYEGVTFRRCYHKKNKEEAVNVVKLTFKGKMKSLHDITKCQIEESHPVYSYEQLEAEYKKAETLVAQKGQSSLYAEMIQKLIPMTLEEGEYSKSIQEIMTNSCRSWFTTQQSSHIAFIQEIATSLGVVPKKTKLLTMSSDSGFKHSSCFLSLDNVTDRMAVSIVNMNAKMGQHVDQTCLVLGQFVETPFTRTGSSGQSRWYNMSPAKLDWECRIFHSTVSYLTLLSESIWANKSEINNGLNQLITHQILGGFIMSINSDKFAVASDMIRYLYVNATGVSVLPDELYNKISNYIPKTLIEKLYVCRMHKMTTLLNLFKTNRASSSLIVKGKYTITGPSGDEDTKPFRVLTICFPHENKPVVDDMHAIDSLYICRNFSIQRYKKTVSEAEVVDKQLQARQLFLDTRKKLNKWEARFLEKPDSVDDLMFQLMTIEINENYSQNSPSPLCAIMGFLVSIRDWEGKTVREKLSKSFNFEKRFLRMSVSKVMNNRGSVIRGNSSCLLQYQERTTKDAETKKKRVEKSNQNSRAYQNLCLAYSDMIKDIPYPPLLPVPFTEFEHPKMTSNDWVDLSYYPDVLWPLLLHSVQHNARHVSKMVHKDQVNIREIAVLNAPARVSCYFVEETARHIRDVENSYGDNTNLIEVSDKNDIVRREYNASRFSHEKGLTTMYDSADCSKWGPTMLPFYLYLIVGLRVTDCNYRSYLRHSLKQFGNKVFKIPDNFYSKTRDLVGDTNLILRVVTKLKSMTPEMGDYDRQIINLPESMHQGILGVSSSCLAADSMRLACHTIKILFNLKKAKGFVTSDDSGKIMEGSLGVEENDLPSEAQMIKKTVSVHSHIQSMYGTKRSNEKSTHSTEKLEFNSEFMTPYGVLKADVKSRVSFIDYGHSTDPYQNALRCMTQSSEYLRVEGSVVGSLWVQLLNTCLSMIQNQSVKLFNKIGKQIFGVPLEYGGYPKLNPIVSNTGSHLNGIVNNYDPTRTNNVRLAFSIITEMMPTFGDMSMTEDEKDMRSRVPKTSRSSVVHLCRRDLRSNRALRDLLTELPSSCFTNLSAGKSCSSVLIALLGCMKREEADSGEESSHLRMSVPQTGFTSKLFRVTNTVWGLPELVSRSDIHNLAEEWLASEVTHDENNLTFLGKKVTLCDLPIHFEYVQSLINESIGVIKHSKIEIIQAAPRHLHTNVVQHRFSDSGLLGSIMVDFDEKYKPACMFGITDVRPMLYLESRALLKQRFEKLMERKVHFRMMQYSNDKRVYNLAEQIMVSCTMSGTRTLLSRFTGVDKTLPIDDNYRFLEAALKFRTTGTSSLVDILAPDFFKKMKNRQVGHIDITEMINAHYKTSTRYSFNDVRSEQWIFAHLAKSNQSFCIVPGRLKPSRVNEIYFGINREKVWCRSRLTDGEPKGLSCVVQENNVFTHFESILDPGDSVADEDSYTDRFKVIKFSNMDYVQVSIEEHKGLVMIKFGDFLITALGPCFPSYVQEVEIHSELPERVFFEKLDVLNHQPLTVFQTSLPDFMEGNTLSEDPDLKADYDSSDDVIADYGEEDEWEIDEDELKNILSEAQQNDLERDEREERSNLVTVVEHYDDEEDPPDKPDLGTEVTISNLGAVVAPTSVYFLASNSLKLVKRGRSRVHVLKLPFKVKQNQYESFLTFLNELESDDQDSLWKVGYIREVIRLFPTFADYL